MVLPALVSALHLLGLGIGLGAIVVRGRALQSLARGEDTLARIFVADNLWGIAALLWIATGLTRLFREHEKALDFYLYNGMFWVKIGLFLVIFALELWPMATLIGWRLARRRNRAPDTRNALVLARISNVQGLLVVGIVFCAAMMARGMWLFA